MADRYETVEERYRDLTGARAAFFTPAYHAPAALAALGVVRPGDRLVVFADDFEDAFTEAFDPEILSFVSEPSPAAFGS